MIIWINGAFGSGKTSVGEQLCKRLGNAHVYDPEMVGYFLWHVFPEELKRKENFQHIDIWREFNYKIFKHLSNNYGGIIIAPMTIYNKQYFDEIIGNLLSDGIDVKHFILSASKQTIIERLQKRGEQERCWAEQHIDKCILAFEKDIQGIKIETNNRSIDDIVEDIIQIIE